MYFLFLVFLNWGTTKKRGVQTSSFCYFVNGLETRSGRESPYSLTLKKEKLFV